MPDNYDDLKIKNIKSVLLVSLWKSGIPAWVRKTIWPLAIINRLEINKSLYLIHKK